MKLSELRNGESAIIVKVYGHGGFRKRITEMGFVRGREVMSVLNSPLQDPVKYSIMGYEVSLRHSEAAMIEILYEAEAEEKIAVTDENEPLPQDKAHTIHNEYVHKNEETPLPEDSDTAYRKNVINVALIGNPNSGKTSLFNVLAGKREHVGNYSGVTIDAKTGHFNYKGYHFNVTDLPGAYSLSAYSPEESFVRRHLYEKMQDVVINIVVASNIERNLYLTSELIDLNPRMVVALNMYDELLESDAKLDYEKLGGMIGVPMTPIVAKKKRGIEKLLNIVIDVFENRNPIARHVHIPYGTVIEPKITALSDMIRKSVDVPQQFPARYWAIKLLERDSEIEKIIRPCADFKKWKKYADKASESIKNQTKEDVETVISNAKYGFITGALQETYLTGTRDVSKQTRRIDGLVTNKWLGFPIFISLMWLMFMATFFLGAYPQNWIETGIGKFCGLLSDYMPEGPLKDLLINGIIGGVGSVVIFLPNILILYLFISFMENSGYMARAAFIMDKLMHKMGLHGKSFIPLIMGFGCNVPAIMASRMIESRNSRLITILINPFMSCSARIPVLLLFSGTFFPHYAGHVFLSLYLLGIIMAVVTARLFRRTLFKTDEIPFVMELPPYRMPTINATLKHAWDKGKQYLRKIGGVILVASIIIWILSYYPRNTVTEQTVQTEQAQEANIENTQAVRAYPNRNNAEQAQFAQSYLGRIGQFCEPAMKPIGHDWRVGVALLSGTAAKEIIVSALGILYKSDEEETLSVALTHSNEFTSRSALSLMVFILLYFPCIASLASIAHEAGKKWALFSAVYNTLLAWTTAYLVYAVAGLF